MTITLSHTDYAALSPFFILLIGALILLLVEAFNDYCARVYSEAITLATLIGAMCAVMISPSSTSPLLTPWLRFDSLAQVFSLLFLSVGAATVLISIPFLNRLDISKGEYFFLLVAAVMGLLLIGYSADFLTLFLGLETLSISLYVLVGYVRRWTVSHETSIKYFLIGAISAALLLYGIALVYGAIGTTRFSDLAPAYEAMSDTAHMTLFFSGIALVTLGFAFKAAIVPLHMWAPDVYDGASTPITAFMAVGTKAGAFAAFALLFLVALPNFYPLWNESISILAYPTLIYANIVALRQVQLRRFFAYSGISHAGFMLIPLAAGTSDALPALVFYLVVYALATMGSFAVISYLDVKQEGVLLSDLKGLVKRSPLLAGAFALCLLTLGGLPPTAGFFAKLYVFKVALEAGYVALVIVGLLTAILSAYYYLRIVAVMFAEQPDDQIALPSQWSTALVGLAMIVGIIVASVYPAPLLALTASLSR